MKSKIINGMVQLDEIDARLMHKNDRVEKHGDADVLACDLDFAWTTGNDALALFHPTLRSDLYMADPDADKKRGETLPGMENPLTILKHPEIQHYKWTGHEIVGGKVILHGVISGKHLEFDPVDVKKWSIEPKNGGTVVIHFRVQLNPDKKHRGVLMDLLEQGTVTLSVIPPEPVKEDAGDGNMNLH